METDSIIQAYQGDSSPTTAATVEIAEQNLYDVCDYVRILCHKRAMYDFLYFYPS